jgi:8-oxo-dGTP pyrophosphatase MutT (NUDIX family)
MVRFFGRGQGDKAAPPAEEPTGPKRGAGGVVLALIDGELCVAAIQPTRHPENAWCLPKGTIERDEAPLQTALREVREETGLLCEVGDHLGVLEYEVLRDGAAISKRTEYWLMAPIGGRINDLPEVNRAEIRDAQWRGVDRPGGPLSHPAERDLVAMAVARLHDNAG